MSSMHNTTYNLPATPTVLVHGWNPLQLFSNDNDNNNNMVDKREFNAIDAQAASGDYFITLATKLDLLAQALPRDSSEQIEVENLVNALFYLQKHYAVIAKHKLR